MKETLCWTCQHAAGPDRCSWSRAFIPVEGWNARRSDLRCDNRMIESYFVQKCPQYRADTWERKQAARAGRMGLELSEKQKEAVQRLRYLHDEQALSHTQIAEQVGYAASSVVKWASMAQAMSEQAAENILRKAAERWP